MRRYLLLGLLLILWLPSLSYADYVRGIYVTQPTLESTKNLNYLIKRSKETGINTFVVDLSRLSKVYDRNIKLLQQNDIRYVARIVVFPNGGTPAQLTSQNYWEKKYILADKAIKLGAAEVQLDYIRYNTKRRQTSANAQDVLKVIDFFGHRVIAQNAKLNIAIFGEVCFAPSLAIGQDIQLFANSIQTASPMVYPSHYYPALYHSQRPYKTIYDSLAALKEKFPATLPFKLVPYIEVNNFRYHYGGTKGLDYIHQQIKAVEDSNADGWYAWSPTNKYNKLFKVLQTYKVK